MSELLKTMSDDMNIPRFQGETDESFVYRLCYSALGQWCLSVGCNRSGSNVGTSKHNQTIVLNELLARYDMLFPTVTKRFIDTGNQHVPVSVAIRRIYEETGYLITDKNNHNRLANYRRSIRFGNQSLLFGLPQTAYDVNGLGVFTEATAYEVTPTEFLIRDNLSSEEYFKTQFDPIDFYERDIDLQELEIFNPLSNCVPSQSWGNRMITDCSVAKSRMRDFYKVMKTPSGVMFTVEAVEAQNDGFTSYGYRRLYFAMKSHYGKPLGVWVTKLDENYSKIRVGGHLPNQEYYFMLLLSWPECSAFDKVNFIIKNSLLKDALKVLENIGLEIKGEHTHE